MLVLIEVVCHNADVGSNPAWSVHVGLLVTQGQCLFPSKVFLFHNLSVLHTGNFNV